MNDFNVEPSIDMEAVDPNIQDSIDRLDDMLVAREEDEEESSQAQSQAEAGTEGDRQLDVNDPRKDGVGLNLADIGAELKAAGLGGLRDTASSVVTLPERVGDMMSGEMQREGADYKPEFNPLGGDKNPITTTWWGSLIRGGVHFASMSAAIAVAVKAAAAAGIAGAGVAAVATGTKIGAAAKGSLALGKAARFAGGVQKGLQGASKARQAAAFVGTGAVKGAVADSISEYSQQDNALGEIKKHYPQFEHVFDGLATNPDDSPMMKTFKNVVEGMGIGLVFEGASSIARRTVRRLRGEGDVPDVEGAARLEHRVKDIEDQQLDMGEMQLELPGFGAYKNSPIADPHQGSPASRPKDGYSGGLEERSRLNEWGSDEEGSMSPLTTPAQLARSSKATDIPTKEIDRIYTEALGDDRFARLMEDLTARNMNPYEVLEDSYRGFMDMVNGRNATEAMNPQEFFDPILSGKGAEELPIKDFGKKIVLMDLINASNAKVLRDYAIAAREIKDVADVFDVDGPMKVIADRMAYGIEQVKTARYLWGQAGREMQTPEGRARSAEAFEARQANLKTDKDKLVDIKEKSREAVTAMMQLAQRSESKALGDAMLEAFSMSNKITNLEDLYKYFDSQLRGGEFGKKSSSMVIRELQGVMVHSVLSGPKTPIRAIMGTTTATLLRPMAQALGGAITDFNGPQMREGLASLNAMREALPEAFKLFRSRLNSYWTGDIATVKTKNFNFTKRDQDWEAIGEVMRLKKATGQKVSAGTEAAYLIANMARAANNSNMLTYSTKIMAATDDAFGFIMARARARQLAMRQALENNRIGDVNQITPKLLKEAEDRFYANFLDEDGVVNFDSDAALKFAREEGTLTRDLSGFSKGLDQLMGKTPWAKPFMLFARTGVNGLELTMKHMPLFNRLVKDERRILNATMQQAKAGELFDLGIQNGQDLLQAQSIMKGRQAMGAGIITMAAMHFMSGNLTGNGPQDRTQRQLWLDSGYRPRSIKIGEAWVSYDSFEPFNTILSFVADIGDHYELMGPEWAEKSLFKTSLVLAQGVTNKSYMAGLQQLVDLLSMQPGQIEKITASLVNNQVPLSSLRNELGRLFNPYMKELNAGFMDNIRNRNQITESLAGEPLPVKYDILNGRPIKDWDFPTRMVNMFLPFSISLDQGPGRTLLFNSGYDMRVSTYSTPDGISLKDSPHVRSLYQQALGSQNLEEKLNRLAENPDIQESIAQMERDRNSGRHGKDPMDYHHNRVISDMFRKARKRAWASIKSDERVLRLMEKHRLERSTQSATRRQQYDRARSTYDQAQEVLNMPIR